MFHNSLYSSKLEIAENERSAYNDYKSLEVSEDSYLAEESSSCQYIKDNNTETETEEQQHIMIKRKRILRRKGSYKSRGKSISSNISPKSSIFLRELADSTSDSCTRTDFSYTSSMENVAKSTMDYELSETDNISLEILREGTKLMKSMKLPTVITRIKNYSLQHSMVYYVTLEAESEEFFGQIPALLFASHYCSGKTTDLAEMLPLSVTKCEWSKFLSLAPMLRSGIYNKIFRKGCNFKITALSNGRLADWSVECPWKQWDLNIKEMQKVIIDIIYDDIRQIPKNILKSLKPLKRIVPFKKLRPLSEKKLYRLSQLSSKETERSVISGPTKLSDYCSDLQFTGLAGRGGSSFAEWFKTIPPHIHVDQNFKCNRGTILTKDNFSDVKGFEKYLCISEKV